MSAFNGKVALITGGSKGIGKATAFRLAKDGAKVVINYSSDAAAAEEVVNAIGKENALAVKGDAGSLEDIEKMVAQTVEKFGKIDILIPNAAILQMRDLAQTTEADFDLAYRLNVKGPYFLVQKAAPYMGPGSHVVLVSTSVCAFSSISPNYLLYASTKGSIEQMTRLLAKDLGRKGINVNCIAPGPTATELFMEGKPEALVNTIKGWSPFNKLGEPEEIADAIAFLSGADARWVSGQVLRANGAMA